MSKTIQITRIKLTEAIKEHNAANPDEPPISRKFLASQLKISYPTVHQWDKGNTVPDSILTLYKMSVFFNKPMKYFIELKTKENG